MIGTGEIGLAQTSDDVDVARMYLNDGKEGWGMETVGLGLGIIKQDAIRRGWDDLGADQERTLEVGDARCA